MSWGKGGYTGTRAVAFHIERPVEYLLTLDFIRHLQPLGELREIMAAASP
jgi:hypothetical protein